MWSPQDSGQPFPGQCVSSELSSEADVLSRNKPFLDPLSFMPLKKIYKTTHSIRPNKSTSMKKDKRNNCLGEGRVRCEILWNQRETQRS